MTILRQGDPRWSAIKIFDMTIGQVGCLSTVISEIIGTTPDVFVARMKALSTYTNSKGQKYTGFLGNLTVWARIAEAFPGISVYRYYGYDNTKVKAACPNVVVEVPAGPIGGSGSHWVRYMGNQKLHDPWTGKERPTSDFPNPTGYAIITGSWNKPVYTKDQALVDIKNIAYGKQDDSTARQQVKNVLAKVGV